MADKQSREEVVNKAKEIGKQSEESGKRVGDALKELTVKISVDVDVSDAITGLKAVQREAKEATKALRGVEAQSGDVSITIDGEAIAESLYKPVRADGFKSAYLPIRAKLFGKRPVTDGGDEPQLYISDKRELFEFTTDELTDELAKRKEVAEFLLEDGSNASIEFSNGHSAKVDGPVSVYVVVDEGGSFDESRINRRM